MYLLIRISWTICIFVRRLGAGGEYRHPGEVTSQPQQNVVSGVQNLNINDDKTPLMSASQASNVQVEQPQIPPSPFLSGVPMVNPGNFVTSSNVIQAPQVAAPQPVSQTQSVVSNMAAYSSNLADATLTNLGSIPSVSNMQPPAPLPSLPGIPMNQPQPYIPMMPNYTQSQVPPAAAFTQSQPLVPTFDMSSFAQAPIQPPPISSGLPVVTPVSLPGMPSITVSATLPVSTMQEIHQQQSLQHQDLLS